ncbi:hypothetical protein ACJX0J_024122, partial [Zea mays]
LVLSIKGDIGWHDTRLMNVDCMYQMKEIIFNEYDSNLAKLCLERWGNRIIVCVCVSSMLNKLLDVSANFYFFFLCGFTQKSFHHVLVFKLIILKGKVFRKI